MPTPLNILLYNLPSFHKQYNNEKPFRASLNELSVLTVLWQFALTILSLTRSQAHDQYSGPLVGCFKNSDPKNINSDFFKMSSPGWGIATIKNWFMLSVRISSYGCTREVWRARKKLLECSLNFPSASITRYTHS